MKQDGKSKQMHGGAPVHGTGHGQPLDGRQYVDVVEEQLYAEQRPTLDAREPHDAEEKQRTQQRSGQQSQLRSPQNTPTGN